MRGQKQDNLSQNDEASYNLRAEYAALANYFNTLIGFRLTLLGFYLAAVGFIVGSNWPISIAATILGILLTASLYIFELRTRILFRHLAQRAVDIELRDWQVNKKARELPLFSRQFPSFLERYKVPIKENYYTTSVKILGFITIRSKLITHSFALDLLYIGILIFFVASLFSSSLKPLLTHSVTSNPDAQPIPTLYTPVSTQISTFTPTQTQIPFETATHKPTP